MVYESLIGGDNTRLQGLWQKIAPNKVKELVGDATGEYIKVPSMTTTERNALTPKNGMAIFNTTNDRYESYKESATWAEGLGGTGSGAPTDASYITREAEAGLSDETPFPNLIEDYFDWKDEFIGDALKDEWDAVATGTGIVATPDTTGEENGTVKLSTGATSGGDSLLRFNRTHFKTDLKTILFAKLKISDVSEADVYIGFRKETDEYCYFHIDNGAIWLKSDDVAGQGPYLENSGQVASDGAYIKLRVELLDTETGVFYINGTSYGTPTVGAVTSNLMDIYIYVVNTSSNVVLATLEYVRIWQKRV